MSRMSGDLVVQARDAELEILAALLERLRRLEPRLRKAAQLLAEVDVIQAPCSHSYVYLDLTPQRMPLTSPNCSLPSVLTPLMHISFISSTP